MEERVSERFALDLLLPLHLHLLKTLVSIPFSNTQREFRSAEMSSFEAH